MRGSLAVENQIRIGLDALGCSTLAFAQLTGMHQSVLSNIFLGKADFTEAQAKLATERLTEMLTLQNSTPASINWSDRKMQIVLHEMRVQKALTEMGLK
jgi:hypothetical protein